MKEMYMYSGGVVGYDENNCIELFEPGYGWFRGPHALLETWMSAIDKLRGVVIATRNADPSRCVTISLDGASDEFKELIKQEYEALSERPAQT